jgi:hypothetical protein
MQWLKEEHRRRGEFEERSLSRTLKPSLSPAQVAYLPILDRWLTEKGATPAALWREYGERERLAGRKPRDFEIWVQPLVRLWERLRRISPEGIPSEPPSKGPG